MSATPTPATAVERDLTADKNTVQVLYFLHAIAPFTLYTLAVVAMVIGAVKHDEVRGTWLDTHYGWLARTCWFGLLWWLLAWGVFWILGFITLGFGMLVLWIFPATVFVWYLYRVFYGWMKLSENRAIS